jgi:hypothetical protein
MQIPILIEPLSAGGFQARAGEPFGLSAQGATAEEAAQRLEAALRNRLSSGSRLALLDIGNGAGAPLSVRPVAADDWVFQAMDEAIAERRRREDEAGE